MVSVHSVYEQIAVGYRPSHADYTYDAKYGIRAIAGGGRASARETAGRVAAGAIAEQILARHGVSIVAWVDEVNGIPASVNPDTSRGQLQAISIQEEEIRRQIEEQIILSEDLQLQETERNAALEKAIDLEAELLELKRKRTSLKEDTNFGAGLTAGVEQFREQNQPGQIGQRLAGDAIGASVNFLSDSLFTVVASAFDPNKNFSLGDAMKGLVLGFGASLLRAVTDALAAQAVAFLIGGAATGGKIEGKAAGGAAGVVGAANLSRAPAGLPSSDKTLLAATPGEFYIREPMARRLGYGFLERLNAGRLLEADFRRMSPQLYRGLQGLAAGGAVAGGAASPSAADRTAARGTVQILPVMVADREQVRKLLRGRGFDEALGSRAALLRSAVSPRE